MIATLRDRLRRRHDDQPTVEQPDDIEQWIAELPATPLAAELEAPDTTEAAVNGVNEGSQP